MRFSYPKWANGTTRIHGNRLWGCPKCGRVLQVASKAEYVNCWCPTTPAMVRRPDLEGDT